MAYRAPKEMIDRLEESLRRYTQIADELSQPQVISDREKFSKLSKEFSSLEPLVFAYKEFKKDYDEYNEARILMEQESDFDLRQMASAEVSRLEPELDKKTDTLQLQLLPQDPNDKKNVLLEIRAGVGGDEAGLFVSDLFRMYTRFSEGMGWRIEIMSASENSAGGYKEIIALIQGEGAYSHLKYESGAHRVQRVPKTETQGRIHTSTVTVAILPEAEEVDVVIDPTELRIDVFRAGGKGGQGVNTTDSAVRITHIPTGEVVECQDERSQLKNKNKAMKVLRTRLLEKARQAQHSEIAADRKSQIGSGFRNERIRTYNFPQSRITDHRIGFTSYDLPTVMEGKIQTFISALANYYQTLALKGEAPSKGTKDSSDDE